MHPDTLQEIARQRTTELLREADSNRLAALARPPRSTQRNSRSFLRRLTRHIAIAR
jgi:GAF domain-containing protein